MRAKQFISEWREDYLYHATDISSAIRIWANDKLGLGNDTRKTTSTTRNYTYALGLLNSISRSGGVIFWIDQNKLRQDIGRKKIKGYDWFAQHEPEDVDPDIQLRNWSQDTDRSETTVAGGIPNFKKYLVKTEVWLPQAHDMRPLTKDETHRVYYPGDARDKYHTNVRVDQTYLDRNILANPATKQSWEQMLADPRTTVKPELGSPTSYQGKRVSTRDKFDQDHRMYQQRREW